MRTVRGLQRYLCKECGYNYTIEKRSVEYSKETKRKTLQLFLRLVHLFFTSNILW